MSAGFMGWIGAYWQSAQNNVVCALLNEKLGAALAEPLCADDLTVRSAADGCLHVELEKLVLQRGLVAHRIGIRIPWAIDAKADPNADPNADANVGGWSICAERLHVDFVALLASDNTTGSSSWQAPSSSGCAAPRDAFFDNESVSMGTTCVVRRQCNQWLTDWFAHVHVAIATIHVRISDELGIQVEALRAIPNCDGEPTTKRLRAHCVQLLHGTAMIGKWHHCDDDVLLLSIDPALCLDLSLRRIDVNVRNAATVRALLDAAGLFARRASSSSSSASSSRLMAIRVRVARISLALGRATHVAVKNVEVADAGHLLAMERVDASHVIRRKTGLRIVVTNVRWVRQSGSAHQVHVVYDRHARPSRLLVRSGGAITVQWDAVNRTCTVDSSSAAWRGALDPESVAVAVQVARSLSRELNALFPLDLSHLPEEAPSPSTNHGASTGYQQPTRWIARSQVDDEYRNVQQSILLHVPDAAGGNPSELVCDTLYAIAVDPPAHVRAVPLAHRAVRVVLHKLRGTIRCTAAATAGGGAEKEYVSIVVDARRLVYDHARVPCETCDAQQLHVHSVVEVALQRLEVLDHVRHSHWRAALSIATPMRLRVARKCRYTHHGVGAWALQVFVHVASSPYTVRVRLHQATLEYAQAFAHTTHRYLERLGRASASHDEASVAVETIIERLDAPAVRLIVDYKPRMGRTLGQLATTGDFVYVARAVPVEEAVLHLRAAHLLYVPAAHLASELVRVYVPNYEHVYRAYLGGIQPVRIVVRFARGAFDVVRLPVHAAVRGDNVAAALDAGMRTFTVELLEMGARAATLAHKLLDAAVEHGSTAPMALHRQGHQAEPTTLGSGLWQAGGCVARGVSGAVAAITSDPYRAYVDDGAWGLAAAAVCAVPRFVARPVLGVTAAVARMGQGAANELEPERRERLAEKYKVCG